MPVVLASSSRPDAEAPTPHYIGLFLSTKAKRRVWELARELVGMSCAPDDCKAAGDHVTLIYKPSSADMDALPLEELSGRAMRVTCETACVRERLLVFGVALDGVASGVPEARGAFPHVSVFVGKDAEWRTTGDALAEDIVHGRALELRAALGDAPQLECYLGVKMTDGSVMYGEWYDGRNDDENDEKTSSSDGGVSSSLGKDEDELNKIRREYLQLCDMFQLTHPMHVRDVFFAMDYDMEAAVQELMKEMTLDTDGPNANMFDEYNEDEYYDDDFDFEYYGDGDSRSATDDSTSVSTSLSRKKKKDKPRKTKQLLFHVGASVTAASSAALTNRQLVDEATNGAMERWKAVQGPNARTLRIPKVPVGRSKELEDLSKSLSELRVEAARGDSRSQRLLREKAAKRAALASIDRERYLEKHMPSLLQHDDDSNHNRVFDLHGFDRLGALRKVETEMIRCAPFVTNEWSVKFITGRGNHSSGGRVIHKTVMRWLDEQGISYEEGMGHVIVRATTTQIDGRHDDFDVVDTKVDANGFHQVRRGRR